MNGSNQEAVRNWIDEWETLPEAEKARIRSLIKALDKNRIQAQTIEAQDRKIAEQAALLDRYDTAMKAQAFQLGNQDRELIRLRSNAKAAEAGDVATLRSTVNFQHSEIMRLKAALAERETAIRECQAERDEARRKLTLKANAMLAGQKRIAELQAEVGALQGDAMIKTHYAAGLMDSVKAQADDIERLKGIADHSNNLAQNRLEELAKLRRELAVARDAAAKLEAKVAELQEAATWRAVSRVE